MGKWSLQLNVAGVSPAGVFIDLPTGVYKVKTHDSDLITEGKGSIRFSVAVEEGEYKGSPQSLSVGTDLSKEGNLKNWKATLLSHGFMPAQIDAGQISIGDASFKGKMAHIFVQAAPEGSEAGDTTGERKYADRKFITPEQAKTLASVKTSPRKPKTAAAAAAPASDFAVQPGGAANGAAVPMAAAAAPQTPQPGELSELLT